MNLASLNRRPNLQPRVSPATKSRRRTDSIDDRVARELAAAETAADIGKVAIKHGIEPKEVQYRAEAAPNLGQFRMVLGNRIRGEQRRKGDTSVTGGLAGQRPPGRQAGRGRGRRA